MNYVTDILNNQETIDFKLERGIVFVISANYKQ